MKKNELIPLTITGMTAEGNGVGRHEGMAVFVPLTAPGDRLLARVVKVKKTHAYAIIERLTEPSPDRTDDGCPAFRQCGGCVYRHIGYEAECRIKAQRVFDAMERIGGVSLPPEPLLPAVCTERYRNKAQYPLLPTGEVGFFAARSHRVVPSGDCPLQPEDFTAAARAFGRWIREHQVSVYDERSRRGLLRHLYLRRADATGELMVVPVINGDRLPQADELIALLRETLGERLKSICVNLNRADTNVILGDVCRTLYGQPYITDILCGLKIRLSPLSFYQVNRDMAEILYRKAAEYAQPDGRDLLDLYCGAGTIGLSMAARARSVTGVEIVPQAVADAVVNARLNGIENARFLCADAAAAADQLAEEGLHPDAVIVDPPRKGCSSELLHTIARRFAPERLVYVSCDPATLARDTAILKTLGYTLRAYTPVDLFPRTSHVETVALLERR